MLAVPSGLLSPSLPPWLAGEALLSAGCSSCLAPGKDYDLSTKKGIILL